MYPADAGDGQVVGSVDGIALLQGAAQPVLPGFGGRWRIGRRTQARELRGVFVGKPEGAGDGRGERAAVFFPQGLDAGCGGIGGKFGQLCGVRQGRGHGLGNRRRDGWVFRRCNGLGCRWRGLGGGDVDARQAGGVVAFAARAEQAHEVLFEGIAAAPQAVFLQGGERGLVVVGLLPVLFDVVLHQPEREEQAAGEGGKDFQAADGHGGFSVVAVEETGDAAWRVGADDDERGGK